MKKTSKISKFTSVCLLAAMAGTATFTVAPAMAQGDTKEKIRLMSSALRARDAGDLTTAKTNLEALISIAPNDPNVARMLDAVNKDIERTSGAVIQAPVYGQAAGVTSFEPSEAIPLATTYPVTTTSSGSASTSFEGMDIDAILAAEQAGQAEQISSAKASIKGAKKLASVDRYAEALQLLDQAAAGVTESTATAHVLEDIKETKADILLSQGEAALGDDDIATAQAVLKKYKAEVGSDSAADSFSKSIKSTTDDPWNQNVEELSPGYAAQVEKVDQLVVKARAQILYGDLEGADSSLRQIEARDPYNAEAKGLQLQVSRLRQNAADLDYTKTRSQMLEEVARGWQRPQVFTLEQDEGPVDVDESIVEKLSKIEIPRVSFQEVPLSRVVETLFELSKEYDTEKDVRKKGVNMLAISAPGEDPLVSMSLTYLTLDKILNFVAKSVSYDWEVQNDAVVFEKTSGDIFMETQFFPITKGTVVRLTGFSDSSGGGGGGAVDPFAADPVVDTSGPSNNEQEQALKDFFERAGVPFAPPSTLAFDGTQLIITHQPKSLDKLKNILRRYDQTKQVEIETKFLEVQEGALEELGFSWNFSNGSGNRTFQTNNRDLASTFAIDRSGSSVTIQNSAGPLPGIPSDALAVLPPPIPNMVPVAAGALDTYNGLGVIDSVTANLVVNALSQKEGTDLLSSPRVTTLSGVTARIVVAQELRYPESYGDIESEVDAGAGSALGGGGGTGAAVTITAGTPQDFTVRNVGVEMEVTPTVEQNQNISLKLEPRVTEFEGFVEYGGPSIAVANDVTVTVPSGFFQPIFSTREVQTEVTIYDGATVVIGGLTSEEIQTVKDKVPVLGDIPLIGRLFRSEGETSLKRNLMIFVTANLISPGGSPVQAVKNIKADTLFQNPTVVTPGGNVSREVNE